VGLYAQFDPPAHLHDFSRVPGLFQEWSSAVSKWFDSTIAAEAKLYRRHNLEPQVQYFNPVKSRPSGTLVEQAITWNAFPKELLRTYSREQAMAEADRLWPLSAYGKGSGGALNSTLYRPHNEYCEWRIFRDSRTGGIKKVVFVSEPPEYYRALFGGTVEGSNFNGDPEVVLDLYRRYVSEDVQLKDLISPQDIYLGEDIIAQKGFYNPYNKWNITHGIIHLASPPNTLTAEIMLGGDASVVRHSDRNRLLVEGDVLICSTGYGGPDRNSDPTIGGYVNALARLGAMITLKNPVGLYMDHIDLAGWSAPDGGSVTDFVKIVRGQPGMIERLEVEVPAERGFSISDVKIGGVPIRYGGQIAECITVKLTGVAVLANVEPVPVPWTRHGYLDPLYPTGYDRAVEFGKPIKPGTARALVDQGEGKAASVARPPVFDLMESSAPPIPSDPHLRRRI
jgi:hypothetical protein